MRRIWHFRHVGGIGLGMALLTACSGGEDASVSPTADNETTIIAEATQPAETLLPKEPAEPEAEDTERPDLTETDLTETDLAETSPVVEGDPAETYDAPVNIDPETLITTAEEAALADANRAAAAAATTAEAMAREEADRVSAEAEAALEIEAEALATAEAQATADAQAAARQAEAEAAIAATPPDGVLVSGAWVKKKRTTKGTWSIVREDGALFVKLDADFSTRNAPDLKIFLSPLSAAQAGNKNAVDGSLLVTLLESNKGAQSYRLPAGTNLDDYKSVLIHCEQYKLLWSAADL